MAAFWWATCWPARQSCSAQLCARSPCWNTLLAGASWMAEYGDPDDPKQWEFIQHFSPYHMLRQDVRYPAALLTTSTRDDRVHPGHARKLVKKLLDTCKSDNTIYYENIEGGHGGAADNVQRAYIKTL